MVHALRVQSDGNMVASPIPFPPADQVERTFAAHLSHTQRYREFVAWYDAGIARLPWWAKEGPCKLGANGPFGPNSHWPADPDLEAPTNPPGAYRLLRKSPDDIEATAETIRNLHGPEAAAAFSKAELKRLEERKQRARDEKAKAGIADAFEREESILVLARETREAIEALDASSSANALAARLILEATVQASSRDDVEDSPFALVAIALRPVRHELTGCIAEVAAEIIDNPTMKVADLRVWS